MKFRPFCSDQFKKVCTKIEPSTNNDNGTAPTDFANHLADRPTLHGVAGGAGGGPPCNSKNTTFKIFKKKGNYYFCSLLGLTFIIL